MRYAGVSSKKHFTMRLKSVLFGLLTCTFAGTASAQSDASASVSGVQNLGYLNIKVWLEGPYSSGSMSTNLNPGLIPTTQPYGGSEFEGTPMYYTVAETVADWTGARADAVDWVLVELRTTSAAADSFQTRAGLLMSDGTIKDTDGTSDLLFVGAGTNDYFVVVRHRNHLPIMSNEVVTLNLTSGGTQYDLTVEANIYPGTASNAAKNLGSGAFGLYAGDANGSGGTGSEDQAAWLSDNGFAGYLDGDFNLSGGGGSEDKAILLANLGVGTLVPEN